MADFCITAVKYDKEHDRIAWVQAREELGRDKVGPWRWVSRVFAVDLIRMGKASFQTRTQDRNGNWVKGAPVVVYADKFLTTEGNRTERDNLGELPEVS
ncbi:hypothetical protein BR1R5_11230 [Pseudomonas sp. BR1R-5]|uniref:DUF3892 domain-containing protein n=1 Tax=unclassified Pseudomonas TaxID=196821 RepID=UPI000F777829|nr:MULTISPECIES: DUF3892 domain-containing protein [unclassified Pseudomonas]RRV49053.1 DUF3892 domain-containing protein [Pseudomonas sp. p106]GLH31737.1 hypothetical protein BR1R5_11230 [Pseudomonas sp. BR1R-5]